MTEHSPREPENATPGVAFDVAFRTRWVGAGEVEDVRNAVEIWPPELPWPLTFRFVLSREDEGAERWSCVGWEIGQPIAREDVPMLPPTETIELTAVLWRLLEKNRFSYQRMAEKMLLLDREGAASIRNAMGRTKRTALNDNYLSHLAREYRARLGESSLMYALALERGLHRTQVRRQLEEAERRGLIPEGLPRRNRADAMVR